MNNSNLFTVCVASTDADVSRARPLCLDCVKSLWPFNKQTAGEMLPTRLSPTGVDPVTHWLCTMTLSQDYFDRMKAFVVSHDIPVVIESAGQQEDTLASKTTNRDAWLAGKGLKVVA